MRASPLGHIEKLHAIRTQVVFNFKEYNDDDDAAKRIQYIYWKGANISQKENIALNDQAIIKNMPEPAYKCGVFLGDNMCIVLLGDFLHYSRLVL